MTYLYAIAALALLIVIHEAGHMLVARLCGMRVEKFSVFFGPALLRRRIGQTTYQLATIPLGGYVQIAGMNPHEELPPDDPGSYQNKPAWMRFLVILAGPAVNYLAAIVVVLLVLFVWGVPRQSVAITEVMASSPAEMAGLRAGDVLRKIGSKRADKLEDVGTVIAASKGRSVDLEVAREGKTLQLQVVPRRHEDGYRIGIRFAPGLRFARIGLGTALLLGLAYPVVESGRILGTLKRLVTRQVSAKQVGGPVEIVHQMTTRFKMGLGSALMFVALLNVFLGLFNLLPLPALDGGRLAFLGVEMVARRPVSRKAESIVHAVGFLLLFGLLLLVTYADIKRRFLG